MPAAAVALFTRDLRVHDNPVLAAAARAERVVCLFVLDDAILRSDSNRPNRARFLAESLADLDAGLQRLGGAGLVVRRGDTAAVVREEAAEVGAAEVHVAADVSGYAQRREQRLREALGTLDERPDLVVHDSVVTVVAPAAVTPDGRDHYAVFSAYHRRWADAPVRDVVAAPARLRSARTAKGRLPRPSDICAGDPSPDLARGGEDSGRALVARWLRDGVTGYGRGGHDDLASDRTSRLSPYLHFGCVSPVALVRDAGRSAETRAFVRQLAWRDFYAQVVAARPDVVRDDYRPRGDRWRTDKAALRRWQQGRTGYPLVDAGMRQLAREGWMHNRARLVTASFLVKTLYVDWRLGAQHFADLLVDADVASNTMNWQWIAGTGTDTRPNRVLNPLLQARRYDPDGAYVRRHVGELAAVDTCLGGAVHTPWKLPADVRAALDYPEPMVDLDDGRRAFLAARGRPAAG